MPARGLRPTHAFNDFKGTSARRLAAFVSATGSAGTIAAGDYLKKRHGTRIAAVEALECPTMLNNGYGEHNIQGIGDKHIPLIHNVMNTDIVVGVSDRVTDQLNLLFGSEAGRKYLQQRRKLDAGLVASFAHVGISGYANIVAAIKLAKQFHYGADDVIVTVATDSGALYDSERDELPQQAFRRNVRRGQCRRSVRLMPDLGCDRQCRRAHRSIAPPDLQPRLLHLGRAAGRQRRGFRAAGDRSRSGTASPTACRNGTG